MTAPTRAGDGDDDLEIDLCTVTWSDQDGGHSCLNLNPGHKAHRCCCGQYVPRTGITTTQEETSAQQHQPQDRTHGGGWRARLRRRHGR